MVKSTILNTNRMLTPDTIVPDPTNPQSLNRFSYVLNRPTVLIDPSGHYDCESGDDYQRCVDWVNDLLDMLNEEGGEVAKVVYLWFLQYDQELQDSGQGEVIFEIVNHSSFKMQVRGNTIQINRKFFYQTVDHRKAALLGHEITHLLQEPSVAFSKAGELAGYYVQSAILTEFGKTLGSNSKKINTILSDPNFNYEKDREELTQALVKINSSYYFAPVIPMCACRNAFAANYTYELAHEMIIAPVQIFTEMYWTDIWKDF